MSSPDNTDRFLKLIQTNKGIIYKVANAYCHNPEDRKDLIQEIIIQLWLSFENYDEKFALTTWIYRIALNVSISFFRKESRRAEISLPVHDDMIYLQDETPDLKTDIDLLNRFIRELKEMDRAIIILYLEGTSHQDSADILGLSPKNISVRVARIKDQLRQKFSTLKSL